MEILPPGASAALAMSTNLRIVLGRHPSEWPWSYLMLVGFSLMFFSTHPGRVLGLGGQLSRYFGAPWLMDRRWATALRLLMSRRAPTGHVLLGVGDGVGDADPALFFSP